VVKAQCFGAGARGGALESVRSLLGSDRNLQPAQPLKFSRREPRADVRQARPEVPGVLLPGERGVALRPHRPRGARLVRHCVAGRTRPRNALRRAGASRAGCLSVTRSNGAGDGQAVQPARSQRVRGVRRLSDKH
jgi:hypothetical protein